MELAFSPELLIAFATLLVLEIVLGIDNVIFISILAAKLPPELQNRARVVGLSLAMIMRILLLFAASWIISLTADIFELFGMGFSGRDLILILGGLFLVYKAVVEIHEKLEGEEGHAKPNAKTVTFAGVIVQILLIDIVFSLDSVITAVGMVDELWIMIAAVVIAIGLMLFTAKAISDFVNRHPTVKMLALAFLVLIGTTLIAEGFDVHIDKALIYGPIAFAIGVEALNLVYRSRQAKRRAEPIEPVTLRPTLVKDPLPGDPTPLPLRSARRTMTDEPPRRRTVSSSPDTLGALVERIMARADGLDEGYRRVGLLVAASEAVTESLELTPRLQTIVSVARELVGARYGALGVIGPDGHLERFLHSGLEADVVARMGELPSGRGILGAVIAEGRSIRLDHLAHDRRSVGFPAHHPPMDSFLGVPIHVGGTVFGNLYLTEHADGPFDDIDEAIIAALAAMAGTAIANSRLYEQSQDDRRWLAASERLSQRLLAGETDPDDLGAISTEVQAVLDDPTARLVEAASGELVIERGASGHPMTDAEHESQRRFTGSIAIARELARARLDQQRIALADERDRIARDLHDHVIQSLFAVGLSLQSVVGDPSTATGARIAAQVDAIDSTIRQIRQAIYRLSAPPTAASYSLRARVNTLVRETLEGEELDSRVEFAGPVDTLVDLGLGDEVAAVTREALSNTVRHAQATHVEVGVAVRGALVVVTVHDDGVGMPETDRRSGLANLAARAHERGGTFVIEAVEPHGTRVRWSVPWEAR